MLDKTVKKNQKHTLDTFDNERKNSNNIISTVVWDDVSDIFIWYYVTEVSLYFKILIGSPSNNCIYYQK